MIYNIKQDFIKRTQKALAGNEKLFQNDAVPRHDYVTEFISKQIKPEHDVLEIGCGYGRWSSLIHAKSYTGVDMTKDRIDYARQNYHGMFIHVKDNWHLDQKFNRILCIKVLQHNLHNDAVKLLKKIKNHLKSDGKAILAEEKLIWGSKKEAQCIYELQGSGHMICKSIPALQKDVPELEWLHINNIFYELTLCN